MADAPRFGPEDPAELRRAAARENRARRDMTGDDDRGARGSAADDAATAYASAAPKKRGCLGALFVGCLWMAVVLLVIGSIAGFWLWQHGRELVADIGADQIKKGIEAAELPAQEKDELGVEVDRLADAFRTGKLSAEQMKDFMRRLAESPLATSIVVAVIENKYFEGSGLSDAEREEGRRELRRFARGVIERKIPEGERDAVIDHVAERDGDTWEMREHVTDDDLRALVAGSKAAADGANIPQEAEVVDLSDELQRIVDEALGVVKGEEGKADEVKAEEEK